MANSNKGLTVAIKAKKDEFYTQLSDIEKELKHYKEHFKGKTVLCNCDDPYESNFFKFFALNFNVLQLKKLICTSYAGSSVSYTQLSIFDDPNNTIKSTEHKPYVITITKVDDFNKDGSINLDDIETLLKSTNGKPKLLKGNGDFRSDECINYLKQSDIVVTNPPFSLFREYVCQLMQYEKQFIIIGNQNAIGYKEIFPLIRDGKLWYGISIHSHGRDFRVPDDYPLNAYEFRTDEKGNKFINVKGVRWFTNIDYKERHEDLILYKHYTPEEYPKYDTFDAIEVKKTAEIPCDYPGVIGVPISFLDKFNPEQFEIVGEFNHGQDGDFDLAKPIVNGKLMYKRIAIKHKRSI